MPTIEGIARASKANLSSSLMVTHNLTLGSHSPADHLMLCMNNVLRSVIDTNFNCSLETVGALYAAIGEVQPEMMDTTSNLAMANFTRSFAVVMEEAIRGRSSGGGNGNSNSGGPNQSSSAWSNQEVAAAMWNANAASFHPHQPQQHNWPLPQEGRGFFSPSPPREHAYGRPPGSAGGASQATSGTSLAPKPGAGTITTSAQKGFGPPAKLPPTPTPTCKFAGFGGVPATKEEKDALAAAKERAVRAEKEAKKDFSPAAIEGRVTVYKIPLLVKEAVVRAYCAQIGPIDSLSYPVDSNGKHKGFALVKYLDNATADLAVAQLHNRQLAGADLSVERARYWFKPDKPRASSSSSSKTLTQGGRVAFGAGGPAASAKPQPLMSISSKPVEGKSYRVKAPSSVGIESDADDEEDSDGSAVDADDSENGASDDGVC